MATKNENHPAFMAVHVGLMVKAELCERGISNKDFAKAIGIQPSHASEFLNGKRNLTNDMAIKIEEVYGLPAKVYLQAQANYQYDVELLKKRSAEKPFPSKSTLNGSGYDLESESIEKESALKKVSEDKVWEGYNAHILLKARKKCGLTQQELANRIGSNKAYISRIERGIITPTVPTFYKIAAAMGMTVELRPSV